MYLLQKLKQYEKRIVFMRWASTAEYGKIIYIGRDFVEFDILDPDTLEYSEKIIINPEVILEITIGGPDIGRVIAGLACKMPSAQENH